MKFKLFLSLFALFISACTAHTIRFRSTPFNTPFVSNQNWSGNFSAVTANPTNVTLVNDVTTNPPTRTSVEINKNVNVADLFLLSWIGFDFGLVVTPSLELYSNGTTTGLKWQFLNRASSPGSWIGALRLGYGSSTSTSAESSSVSASSKITTQEGGISFGYVVNSYLMPYISYVYDQHNATTDVTNANGSFSGYVDNGIHRITSFGIATASRGLDYGLEYNAIDVKWDRSQPAYQNSMGMRLGFRW